MTLLPLRMDQQIPMSVRFTDENDNPVSVDGVPTWSISDDTIVYVEGAPHSWSVVAVSGGTVR